MESFFVALEQSSAGLYVRNAHLLYPIANIAHVLGVLVFFALVAGMDMAVLRRPYDEAMETIQRARPYAIAAFFVIVAGGLVMFTAEASAIVRNPAFIAKMMAIAIAGLNLLLFTRMARTTNLAAMRSSASVSLVLWLFTAAAGRGIAYL